MYLCGRLVTHLQSAAVDDYRTLLAAAAAAAAADRPATSPQFYTRNKLIVS